VVSVRCRERPWDQDQAFNLPMGLPSGSDRGYPYRMAETYPEISPGHSFTDNPRTSLYILTADESLRFGTAMIDGRYGDVISFDIELTADEETIDGMDGILAVLFKNPRREATVEMNVVLSRGLPGLLAMFTMPYSGGQIQGRVTHVQIKGALRGLHKLSIKVKDWLSLPSNASAFTINPQGEMITFLQAAQDPPSGDPPPPFDSGGGDSDSDSSSLS
jgi:hypothetical protein